MIHPIAQELNEALASTILDKNFSPYGKRIYFPKGIVSQAAEAGKSATTFNATVGMAFRDGEPMILPTIQDNLPRLSPTEAVSYAPTGGDAKLRAIWKEKILEKNPGILEDGISMPAVVPGITNGISQVAELFIDSGDAVFISELCWDNYPLIFETKCEGKIFPYPLFNTAGGLNVQAIEDTIRKNNIKKKAFLLVNFPHNPTGYSPSKDEAKALSEALIRLADEGIRLTVICDDAYFGLFYDDETYKSSVFTMLYNAHENILAVKIDGATKEDYVWGFRLGFITIGSHGLTDAHYKAWDSKITGAIRASISSSSRVAQTLLYKELSSLVYHGIKTKYAHELEERFKAVKKILETRQTGLNLKPMPFNSGYFMCFEVLKGSAEELRKALLKNEGIGTIAMQDKYLRIAYASVDIRDLKALYNTIFTTADAVLK